MDEEKTRLGSARLIKFLVVVMSQPARGLGVKSELNDFPSDFGAFAGCECVHLEGGIKYFGSLSIQLSHI